MYIASSGVLRLSGANNTKIEYTIVWNGKVFDRLPQGMQYLRRVTAYQSKSASELE